MSEEQDDKDEQKMLDLASELTRKVDEEEGSTMALKVIMLVQYIGSDGKTTDSYFHAGDPRFTELFGMLHSHKMRVEDWFENQLIAQQERDAEDDDF